MEINKHYGSQLTPSTMDVRVELTIRLAQQVLLPTERFTTLRRTSTKSMVLDPKGI